MAQYKPSIVACILFVLFGISSLLIVVAVMLQLDRPSLADTQALASYSKHETHASANVEAQVTQQKASQNQKDSVADTAAREPSVNSTASGIVDKALNLTKPKTSFARPVSKSAKEESGRVTGKPAKISGKSPERLPTWNFKIGAPIFYRPSPEIRSAAPENVDSALDAGAKPVCSNLSQTSGNGRVIFPLPDQYLNSYEDTWGAARVQGAHEGTDLMAPEGTPEYAITDGTLVPVSGANSDGWNTLGGFTVMLRADYDMGPIKAGDLFYYAHMREKSALPIGTHVQAGQVLGYVGDTGQGPEVTRGLFPPHLHLGWYDMTGLRTNLPSGAMNPYPLLEWLKANGGLISGGSSTRYCEAPQSEEPIPSTGSSIWPSSSSPGTMPDLVTGTGNARPSPVADHKVRTSERTSVHPEATRHRHAHNPVQRKAVENTQPNEGDQTTSASSRRVSSPQPKGATAKRSHRTVREVRDRISWHNRGIGAIFHRVEERVSSLDRGRLRNALHGQIGSWLRPHDPGNPQEKKHAGSARKHHTQPEKDLAGKDNATKPEPADDSRKSDEPATDETTCDAGDTGLCPDTNTEPPVSEPDGQNAEGNEPTTTSSGTASETLPEPGSAEQKEEITSTVPEVTDSETNRSESTIFVPESTETSQSAAPESGVEPASACVRVDRAFRSCGARTASVPDPHR